MSGKTLRYVAYYDTEANASEARGFALAATHKMDYIISVLNRAGYSVEVVSASTTLSRRAYRGKVVPMAGGNTLRLFPTLPWGGKLARVLSVVFSRLALLLWLLINTRVGENVIVYHSLGYAGEIALAKTLRHFRLILEVEEIYGDVTGRESDRRREHRLFAMADAFVFSTGLLDRKLNAERRPSSIVSGSYRSEPQRGSSFRDGRTHLVYAGTFDPRKGCGTAVAAARYLDEGYRMHIIGFGSEADSQLLVEAVNAASSGSGCRVTIDGCLVDEEYQQLIQSCHIGLCTQSPSAGFSETSFPSKVLSYLSNGLRVVSIRIPSLEQSDVSDLLFYYDEDDPRAVARTVMGIDLTAPYCARERLRVLDRGFSQSLLEVLGD